MVVERLEAALSDLCLLLRCSPFTVGAVGAAQEATGGHQKRKGSWTGVTKADAQGPPLAISRRDGSRRPTILLVATRLPVDLRQRRRTSFACS